MTARADTPKKAGELDESFAEMGLINIPGGSHGSTRCVVEHSQGKLVYVVYQGRFCWLRRAMADGSPDPEFGEKEGVTKWQFEANTDARPTQLLAQADGKLLLIGSTGSDPFMRRVAVTRFNENGTPDLIFGKKILPFPVDPVPPDHALTTPAPVGYISADGQLLLASGYLLSSFDGSFLEEVGLLHRFDASGKPDLDFGTREVRFNGDNSKIQSVDVLPDNRIVVFGSLDRVDQGQSNPRSALACYTPKGELDRAFATDGYWEADDYSRHGQMQVHEDKVIFSSSRTIGGVGYLAVNRLLADGSVDFSFNSGKTVLINLDVPSVFPMSIAVQSDRKIVVAGYTFNGDQQTLFWLRVSEAGVLDKDFAEQGISRHAEGYLSDGIVQRESGRIIFAADLGPYIGEKHPKVIGVQS
ncbi:hypothetical protein PMI34_03776 [Pseudomonas sp. GM74]|uniref:delta-60 repeat domain-containing protein n=1 Tax=Pseudomonas sp. GM74 TaxID=1144336 RepID=UPI0002709C08|nr:delta-60 repeat domain-containing protein [Pseudomonas sp. GM74]EJM87050.1 hypothetical protein PMI34_03776 [Pseudomonas sp. GM74]